MYDADHDQRTWKRNYPFYCYDDGSFCHCTHPYQSGKRGGQYHTVNLTGRALRIFKKIDHMMIFVLIAGSYTPVCLIVLGGEVGYKLLALVWGIALIGMGIKAVWVTCPKWFSSIIYIAMGWVCVLVFGQLLENLPTGAFLWLLAGGIIYTVGGVIYAMKLSVFNAKHKWFGSHEVFHLFVMAGSVCHFICMYLYVA